MSYRSGPLKRPGEFRSGGGGGGHGYGRGRYFDSKRSRFGQGAQRGGEDDNVRENIDLLISTVCQKFGDGLEKNIEGLVSVLLKDVDKFRDEILKVLVECVVQIPSRTTVYTTVIGLINAKNSALCSAYLERAMQQLKAALRSGEFETALTLVRSFADLANARVVSLNSVMQLFEALLSAVQAPAAEKPSLGAGNSVSDVKPSLDVDEVGTSGLSGDAADEMDTEHTDVPQARRDFFAYAVLSALPYVGRELHLRKSADLTRLLDALETYRFSRSTAHIRALSVFDSSSSESSMPEAEDYLDCLWHQVSNLRSNGWLDKALYRPYRAFDNVLGGEQHELGQLVPPAHRAGVRYPPARVTFRLFECTDVPEDQVLPGTHTIERNIVEEHLRNVLQESSMNRRECAEALLDVPATRTCGSLPLDYLVIEVLFGELLRLPRPALPEAAYAALLLELCKQRPNSVPLVLAQTTEMLFDALPTMHVACIDRFVSWLSFHLANFYYQWTFNDWFEQLNESDAAEHSPAVMLKAHLLRETLERCCRSSYYEKLRDTLGDAPLACTDETLRENVLPRPPVSYSKFDPSGPTPPTNDVPFELYLESPFRDAMLSTVAQLRSLILSKATADKLLPPLRSLHRIVSGADAEADAAMGEDAGDGDADSEAELSPICTDVLLTTLLVISSKTMSHTNAFLDRYRPTLVVVLKSDRQKAQALRVISEVYAAKQQLVGFVIQKLHNAGLLDPAAVANWVFSDEMRNRITYQYSWEILWFAVDKLNAKVRSLQTEFTELDRKYEAHQRRTRDGIESTELKCASDELNDDAVQRKEEALTEVRDEQKRVYLIIFQRFVMVLNERLERGASTQQDATFRVLLQRMLQGFLLNCADLKPYLPTLESLIFTSDVDEEILRAFDAAKALCSVI